MKNIKEKLKIVTYILAAMSVIFVTFNIKESLATENTKTIEEGTYVIKSAINDKFVLDIEDASKANEANLQIYQSNGTNAQKFKVKYLNNGYYTIESVNSGKVLDVDDAKKTQGTNVQQYDSNNTDAQKWTIKKNSDGTYSLVSKCNNLYMDVKDGIASNSRNVQVYGGNGTKAQKFKFEKVADPINYSEKAEKTISDGTYTIKSAINDKFVLDIDNASKSNGANVQIYQSNGTNAQKFKVKYLNNGYYTIESANSGKVLDVDNAGKNQGTNVQQYGSNNTDAQKWIIAKNTDGTYSIVSKCNNLYLDVKDGIASSGKNIQVYGRNGTRAQKFKFEVVTNNSESNNVKPQKTIADGTYTIKSAINDKFVLDIDNASKSNGANVQIYQSNGTNAQKFKVKYLNNGYYTIESANSGKVLDVDNAGKNQGTNVQQYGSNNTDAQKWIIAKNTDGTYSIVSKCNNLYLDVKDGIASSGKNIQVYGRNGTRAQKFKFEVVTNNSESNNVKPQKTIADGTYTIKSSLNTRYVFDIAWGSTQNYGNLQLYQDSTVGQQRFKVKYLGDGYYSITAAHSGRVLDVSNAGKTNGTNVQQYSSNNSDAQKWIIAKNSDGTYSIVSKCNNLYMDVKDGIAGNNRNIQMYSGNGTKAQKFVFVESKNNINIDETKYPGYKEKIQDLIDKHPNWNFELLYTGLKFDNVVAGEYRVHSRNLVPTSYGGEWICSVCGTTLYDSGWYCASEKAIAYYMDPRNFLDETNVFQFQNLNSYLNGVCSLEGVKSKVSGTFLQNYANDIDTACRNKNVNSYYIVARLLQEQGNAGTTIGKGMNGGDGKTYYNPFNIGASGNGWTEIYKNALATAKSYGWDTMEKALEGGIDFCKKNWLENYQNTLYQNKFDIDTRNGTALYEHQYMQNLMGAYSEARTLKSMYANTGKTDANFTFIIPVYEKMNTTAYAMPVNNSETSPINVKVTANGGLFLREKANTSSKQLRLIPQGTVILSVQRGINSNWQKVITEDGLIGYMSGTYLSVVNDVTNCNYIAKVKTNDGSGCKIRIGPSINLELITTLLEGTEVRVIDKGRYNNIDGYDWCRIQLSDGRQAFMPIKYLK